MCIFSKNEIANKFDDSVLRVEILTNDDAVCDVRNEAPISLWRWLVDKTSLDRLTSPGLFQLDRDKMRAISANNDFFVSWLYLELFLVVFGLFGCFLLIGDELFEESH